VSIRQRTQENKNHDCFCCHLMGEGTLS
jgi:hypothetical protein